MSEKEKDLEKLKEKYNVLKVKYKLPDFTQLNQNFEIESIDSENTEVLLKHVRKHVTEKLFYILRTLETFLNPQNAPLFIFDIIKTLGDYEKELISTIYKKLVVHEIDAMCLEANYHEEKEAEFIKSVFEDWKEVSGDLDKIFLHIKQNFDKVSKKDTKSYFG